MPRKGTPATDQDVTSLYFTAYDNDGDNDTEYIAWPTYDGNSFASGVWVKGEPRGVAFATEHANTGSEASDQSGQDVDSMDGGGLAQVGESAHDEFSDQEETSDQDETLSEDEDEGLKQDRILARADAMWYCGGEEEGPPCYCEYHSVIVVPTPSCEGEDRDCFCVCHGHDLYNESIEEEEDPIDEDDVYGDSESETEEPNEDQYEEDDTLWDSEELVGMLYESTEPPVLLACKEIRDQCLPVYYSNNSFSWRFQYLDYSRSLRRFQSWAEGVGVKHWKLVSQLTLEGRHSVEEGVGFTVDIDLLKSTPWSTVKITSEEDILDSATRLLLRSVQRDLVWIMWLMSKEGIVSPTWYCSEPIRLRRGRRHMGIAHHWGKCNPDLRVGAEEELVTIGKWPELPHSYL